MRGLRRSNGSHVDSSTTEGIGGSHLVHVHDGLRMIDGLLLGSPALLVLHLSIVIGWLTGVVALLCRIVVE